MGDHKKTFGQIRCVLHNLRSLHHISANPVDEPPPELHLLTRIAFMHSVATRSMWQNCFRKHFGDLTYLNHYLHFFVHACDSISRSAANVFEFLLSILALTANMEVFFHNRGYEYMEYSEGIIEAVFKARDFHNAFKECGDVLGLNTFIKMSGYPSALYGVVKYGTGYYVIREASLEMYCKKLDPLIPKLKFSVETVKGNSGLPQLTFYK